MGGQQDNVILGDSGNQASDSHSFIRIYSSGWFIQDQQWWIAVLLMNKGNLLKAGTAAELISSIESKVAQRLCTEEEAEAYQQQYGLGLLLQQQAGQLLRLVGDQLPAEFEPASGISLEEVYLYYCSSDSII